MKFYFDPVSHWVTNSRLSTIPVATGNFQSELGCPVDWQPDCLRTLLEDVDGDGISTYSTSALPVGSYETKVATRENWDVNYGAGGVSGARTSRSPLPRRETRRASRTTVRRTC